MLFDRRSILLCPLALAACGFTPVYAPGQSGSALQGSVRVQAPDDRDTYILVQELEQRLGQPAPASYDLSFVLFTEDEGQAVTVSGDITRYSVVGRVDYILREIATEAIVASGQVDNFTGYSATGSTVETLASERDAYARLMRILAEQITVQLYSTADLSA